tara:strand:+ start:12549 stop:12890 length:342 start_codon:yes stop_codon:yes gene_type:complete
MTCTAIPYIASKYSIKIDVTEFTAVTPMASFTELTLTATLISDPATVVTSTLTGYTLLGGGLVVAGEILTWETSDTLVTVEGQYQLKLTGVISSQNVAITLCEGRVQYFQEHN